MGVFYQKEDALTDPINATSDQSTTTLFPRLPYKLPAVALTATLAALVMRMSRFGINDSIVAALGLGIVVWMGLIYVQSFRRWRIHRAIFTKYLNGFVWNSVCFHDKNSVGLLKFDNNGIGATVVDDTFETGYQNCKFGDIDTDYVLRKGFTSHDHFNSA